MSYGWMPGCSNARGHNAPVVLEASSHQDTGTQDEQKGGCDFCGGSDRGSPFAR